MMNSKDRLPTKRITLEQLTRRCANETYAEQYRYVCGLLDSGRIRPVKASGTNGKRPALYREYWLAEEQKDYEELREELTYQLVPLLSVDYYLNHPAAYEQDREWVLKLNAYLKEHRALLEHQESVNERSFEIWNREKFLSREQGKRILKRCGLELDFLNVYGTAEPLSYYSHTRDVPQKLLILENKDTFYSMRRHLLEGNESILGERIGTLIYGAGKGIWKSFQDFELCVEPYMKAEGNEICYFGDLDYEGIGIYESLAGACRDSREIVPFVPAYEAMLEKAGQTEQLPETKEMQNRNIRNLFFSYFTQPAAETMRRILEAGRYIPQEILNISDF
ncbi:MAG: hypothetical protein HFH19_02235 [Ruminococcus sp.]|nr:hypothetical protein [Ruminococcus sp.]